MAIDERELDDSALVEAAQGGDHEAFAELFRRHYPTVRRVCTRRLGNAAEADEIAQAAFVRAFERLHQCEGERRFGAWVQVIAYNLGADSRRHHARSLLTDEPVTGDAALGPNHCEDHILREERVAEVRQLLDDLPPRQREVIIARDLEGQRPGEIAASLGLTLGAVDSLLLRARRRMAVAWRATTPEQGAATFPATAGVIAGAAVTAPGAVGRFFAAVSRAVGTASYHIASSVGVVPGSPLPARVGGAVVVGALAAAPVAAIPTAHTAPAVAVPVLGVQHVSLPSVRSVHVGVPSVPAVSHRITSAVPSSLPKVTGVIVTKPAVAPGTQRVAVHTPAVSAPTPHPGPVVALLEQLLAVLGLHR